MEARRKRHCWECRRRYLVCDSTAPACRRCSSSGIRCPGYNAVKPTRLKWLAPGKVTARGQRRRAAQPDGVANTHGEIAACTMIDISPAIPRFEMGLDISAVAQGAEYYNSCIYQELLPLHELGQNPHIYLLTNTHLQLVTGTPSYLQYGMVCMALSHRINRTRRDLRPRALYEKFYRYWGVAVRSLNEHLGMEDRRLGDVVIAGILTLLLTDIQQGDSLYWRCHLEGVQRLISLRGGFHALSGSTRLEPLLQCYWTLAVFGNTTCPASSLAMTKSQLDALGLLVGKAGSAVSPFQGCSPTIFVEMVKLNHLRMRAAQNIATRTSILLQEAHDILEAICRFSPERWAESKPLSTDDWVLIGSAYQAAAALYCMLSLQSLSVLPTTAELRGRCAAYGQLLQILLCKGLSSPRTNRFLVWPLVLLGVEAVHGGAAMRAFVAKQLTELSCSIGIYLPLLAKLVLEAFWASGETCWDACFRRPYIFTSQIAVDSSDLLLHSETRNR